VNYTKTMRLGEFIIHLCAPIHHPPHKVRAWLSLLKDPKDYRDHFPVSKLLTNRKFTLEQLEIVPFQTLLFEKQSIDTGLWFFDKLSAIKENRDTDSTHYQPSPTTTTTTAVTHPFQTISPVSSVNEIPPQLLSPTHQPQTMFPYQNTTFSPNNYYQQQPYNNPPRDRIPLSHSPDYALPFPIESNFSRNNRQQQEEQPLSPDEKLMQTAIYASLQEARKDDEKRKAVEKKNQEYQASVKDIQEFLQNQPKTQSKATEFDELLLDQPYDDDYDEDFNYEQYDADYQEEGESGYPEDGEGQGEDAYPEDGEGKGEEGKGQGEDGTVYNEEELIILVLFKSDVH